MDETQGTPVEGQSHWCDGKIVVEGSYKKRPCRNIVRNDSDHCAAGHKNRPRPVGFTSVIANDDLVTHVRVRGVPVGGLGSYSLPVTLAFEVGDLAAAAPSATKEPSREGLVREILTANDDLSHLTQSGNYRVFKDAQRRISEATLKLSELASATESRVGVGWSHEEAKKRGVVERLDERCAAYSNGQTCRERPIKREDWCERCIAASEIERLRGEIELYKDGIEKLRGEIASSTDAYDWWPEILFVSGLSGKRACICSNCGAVAPPNEAEDGYACPDCFWSCGKGQSWE